MQKIAQIDKVTKEIIKVWNSYKEATEFYEVSNTTIYKAVGAKINKESCGSLWFYYDNIPSKKHITGNRYALFKSGSFYKLYVSINRIGHDLGLENSEVEKILNNEIKHNVYKIKQL
ncbi:MAG: hypothetical protein RSE41_01100 [Clostridia bacterium]